MAKQTKTSVQVFFVTNRNPNREKAPTDFGGDFNQLSVDNLRLGVAECEISSRTIRVSSIRVAPENLAQSPDLQVLGSTKIFAQLRKSMVQGRDTLVFVHGYNVTFKEALETGARIHKRYRRKMNVVVFSWPSDGSMAPLIAYKRDRTDAAASGPAFARALLKLRDFLAAIDRGKECGARIHLMAHSMGNYVLRHGVQEALRHGGVSRLFDHIFLMAADEDDDTFAHEHKLRALPRLSNGISVYFNRGDTALIIADKTKNNPTRLGSQGPREPLNVPANVTNIDVSEIVTGLVEHSYFVDDRRVVSDVEKVMSNAPHDRITKRRYSASQNRYVLTK